MCRYTGLYSSYLIVSEYILYFLAKNLRTKASAITAMMKRMARRKMPKLSKMFEELMPTAWRFEETVEVSFFSILKILT